MVLPVPGPPVSRNKCLLINIFAALSNALGDALDTPASVPASTWVLMRAASCVCACHRRRKKIFEPHTMSARPECAWPSAYSACAVIGQLCRAASQGFSSGQRSGSLNGSITPAISPAASARSKKLSPFNSARIASAAAKPDSSGASCRSNKSQAAASSGPKINRHARGRVCATTGRSGVLAFGKFGLRIDVGIGVINLLKRETALAVSLTVVAFV